MTEQKGTNQVSATSEYEKLWRFFEFHASQRIATFKFFMLICGFIITGYISIFANFEFTDDSAKSETHMTTSSEEISLPKAQSDLKKNDHVQHLNTPDSIQKASVSSWWPKRILSILGLMLILMAFIFYKLDNRNISLIKLSIDEIIRLETSEETGYKIFTKYKKSKANMIFTYTFCLRSLFLLFFLTGIVMMLFPICSC